jgi:hypothetical protein
MWYIRVSVVTLPGVRGNHAHLFVRRRCHSPIMVRNFLLSYFRQSFKLKRFNASLIMQEPKSRRWKAWSHLLCRKSDFISYYYKKVIISPTGGGRGIYLLVICTNLKSQENAIIHSILFSLKATKIFFVCMQDCQVLSLLYIVNSQMQLVCVCSRRASVKLVHHRTLLTRGGKMLWRLTVPRM